MSQPNLYARVRILISYCARDRGCGVHPVFPAPSLSSEGGTRCKTRTDHVARMRTDVCGLIAQQIQCRPGAGRDP